MHAMTYAGVVAYILLALWNRDSGNTIEKSKRATLRQRDGESREEESTGKLIRCLIESWWSSGYRHG